MSPENERIIRLERILSKNLLFTARLANMLEMEQTAKALVRLADEVSEWEDEGERLEIDGQLGLVE